ncbi:hypothetical protein GF385_01725 [Candidatus Dependentiae bacterium]|nr:hypothetical protein [Candidatus Dependentiae bacterium]
MKGILKKFFIISILIVNSINATYKDNLIALLDQNKHLSEINYYESKEVNVNFFDKQLVLKWDTVGHDDILSPFKGIKPFVRKIKYSNGLKNDDKLNATTIGKKVAKVALKNKIKNLIGNNSDEFLEKLPKFIRWIFERLLKDGKLTPREEFILRSYILYKTPFDEDRQILKQAEFAALVFKLALTEGQSVMNSQENGFADSLINSESTKELLGSDFVEFANDILKSVSNNFKNCNFDTLTQKNEKTEYHYKVGYVFKTKDLAENCYSLFEKEEYTEKEFKKIVDNYINILSGDVQDIWAILKSYEKVSLKDFREYKKSTTSNFVGFTDCEKDLEFAYSDSDKNSSSNIVLNSKDDEYWVILKVKKSSFDFYNTLKYTIAAIYKAFEEYKDINNLSLNSYVSFVQLDDTDRRESKRKLDNLIKARKYLQDEIANFDEKIDELENVIKSSDSNPWNNLFVEEKRKDLEDIKYQKECRQKMLRGTELEIKKMGSGIYYLNDSEYLNNLSDKGFIKLFMDMLLDNPRVKEFVNNINNNPEYKSVKENLIERLAKVFGQSEYVKEYWEVIEYVLQGILPDYKNDFKQFADSLNNQDNSSGNIVFSLFGL